MTTTQRVPLTMEPHSELQALNQWVTYTATKVPHNPANNTPAKSNDPTTWGGYAQATRACNVTPWLKGVGLELVEEQGYIVFDFDKCITDGQIDPAILARVKKLNSYTEYSPSDTGLHVWTRGQIPANVKPSQDNTLSIEIYSHDRYITWTGKHVAGTPITIESRYEEVLELYNEMMEERQQADRERYADRVFEDAPAIDSNYGMKALLDERQKVANAPEGYRNEQLNKSAYALGQLVGGACLARSTVERDLYTAAAQAGLSHAETERTMRSGLDSGMNHPRKPKPSQLPKYKPGDPAKTNGNGNGLPAVRGSEKPVITIIRQLEDIVEDTLAAIAAMEYDHHTIFIQTGNLVKVSVDEEGRPRLKPMGIAELRNEMTAAANYYRQKGEDDLISVSPPKEVAEAILALEPADLPFPPIKAIVQMPVMRASGTILSTPGYDAETHLYYYPDPCLLVPIIPDNPTQQEIARAVEFVSGFFGDFPYVDQADRANTLGLVMTTVVRQLVRHVPMALISAAKAGTGKGLLTDGVSIIATGQAPETLPPAMSDEELDKRITALLLTGATFVSIDNVEGVIRSPVLAKALTQDVYTGRILGQSKMVNAPQRAIWLANGNNIQLGGDMPRRCYPVNMMVQVSDPWARTDFKYPDLLPAIHENRGKIIAALLTIARGWFLAGKPVPRKKLTALGTFSEWVNLVGGMLSYAGVDGFLENLVEMHEKADIDGRAWALFLETWLEKLGTSAYTTKELLAKLNDDPAFAEVLPDPIATWFGDPKLEKSLSRKVGKALDKKNNAPFGPQNLRIVKGENLHSKVATFKVAGFAGFAGYDLSLRMCESVVEVNKNINIEKEGIYTPHTPHTPQVDSETPQRDKPPVCEVCGEVVNGYYGGRWLCKKHYEEVG